MTMRRWWCAGAATLAAAAPVAGASGQQFFGEAASAATARDAVEVELYGGPIAAGRHVADVTLDVAEAVASVGLVAEAADGAEASFGRASLRFIDADQPDRPYDIRDGDFEADRSTLAPSEARARLGADAVGEIAAARTPEFGARNARGAELRYVPGGFTSTRRVGGLDIEIAPHARVGVRDDRSSAGAGALVRIGQNINEPRDGDARGWYFFAGADAQAVTWRIQPGLNADDALRLEDRAIVGDAQAGVAFRLNQRSELAFGVIHREMRFQDTRVDEQFAGVSFSITR